MLEDGLSIMLRVKKDIYSTTKFLKVFFGALQIKKVKKDHKDNVSLSLLGLLVSQK